MTDEKPSAAEEQPKPPEDDAETDEEERPRVGFPATADDAPPPADSNGPSQFLQSFLKLTPFRDLHQKWGEPEKHTKRGAVCFFADFMLHLLAAVLLLALAYKAIFPLPPIVH